LSKSDIGVCSLLDRRYYGNKINKDKLDGACGTYEKVNLYACDVLVLKPEGRKPNGKAQA
jgi:hypothetical protein